VCRSDTFDNVTGKFPIGFLMWDLGRKEDILQIKTDVYEIEKSIKNPIKEGIKFFNTSAHKSIGDWRSSFYLFGDNPIGYMIIVGPSMQSNNNTFFTNQPAESYIKKGMVAQIKSGNLIEMSIYLAIRHSIETTWLNNKDIFLNPNNKWKTDLEFKNDCLTYTLFCNSNNVSSNLGKNFWIPFSEQEVNSREKFDSNFMSQYIKGKLNQGNSTNLFDTQEQRTTPLEFSPEATEVFNAGRELWKYYQRQSNCNVNASLYDIREYFQGRNDKGKMNNKSDDETYMKLIGDLREKLRQLAEKIEPKVYEYEFLKQ